MQMRAAMSDQRAAAATSSPTTMHQGRLQFSHRGLARSSPPRICESPPCVRSSRAGTLTYPTKPTYPPPKPHSHLSGPV